MISKDARNEMASVCNVPLSSVARTRTRPQKNAFQRACIKGALVTRNRWQLYRNIGVVSYKVSAKELMERLNRTFVEHSSVK